MELLAADHKAVIEIRPVPFGGFFHGLFQVPAGAPPKLGARLRTVEMEQLGFMRV